MALRLGALQAKVRAGGPVWGAFCELPCPETVEIAALAGWDFAVVDCEHAPIAAAQLAGFVRAGAAAGMPCVVRVPANEAPAIQHALDAGAAGVLIPQIGSLEAACAAVAAARFHPEGRRGFNPFVRAAGFSSEPVAEFLAGSNRDTVLALQIETAAGLDALEDIVELAGIDVLFVGPYDLSQSLGVPGQTAHTAVLAAGARLARLCTPRGIALGCFTNSLEEAGRWRALGARFLCYAVDTALLLRASREALDAVRGV